MQRVCFGNKEDLRCTLNIFHHVLWESENENEDSDAMIEIRAKITLPPTTSTLERRPMRKKVPKRNSGGRIRWKLYLITGSRS